MPRIYGYTEIFDDLLVHGSFSVLGSASVINTTNLLVSDPIILLAGSQSGTPALDSGFFINRGTGATQAFIWDESADEFAFISTNDSSEVIGDVNISNYSGLRVGGFKLTDGTEASGYILTSNGSGDATWQASTSNITGIIAGTGLAGGGTQGSIDLGVNLGINGGLTFSGDNIVFDAIPIANAGLVTNDGNTLEVDLLDNGGLTFSGNSITTLVDGVTITINPTTGELEATTSGDISGVTAGDGLSGGGSTGFVTLDVNTTNGLSIISDAVGLGGTLVQNTTIDGATFDLTLGNFDYMLFTASSAFDVESNFVSLDSGTGSTQILSGGDTTISSAGDLDLLATNGVYVVGSSFSVNAVEIDPTSATTGQALIFDGTKFVPTAVSTGDITGVTAGSGLTGGGSSGFVTLDVNTTNGLGIISDAVGLGGTLVQNTTISGDGNLYDLSLTSIDEFTLIFGTVGGFGSYITDNRLEGIQYSSDYSATFVNESLITKRYVDNLVAAVPTGDITGVTAGNGLSGGGTQGFVTLDVNTSNGVTVIGDSVQLADTVSGSGLTFSAGVINVGAGTGILANVDDVAIDFVSITGTGLTQSGGVINVDYSSAASSLQGNGLTANAGVLDVNVNADSLEITSDVIRLKDTITGNRTFADSVYVSGNLTISGTATYVNTEDLYVSDNIITLNATYSTGSPFLDAGIEVSRGSSASAALIWDEVTDYWSAGLSGSESIIITEAGTGLTKTNNELSINFTSAASNLDGVGLIANGSVIDVDLLSNGGLTFSGNEITALVDGSTIIINPTTGELESTNTATITGVTAGVGLTGGGSSGFITIDAQANNGLSISSDNIQLGGSLIQNTVINATSSGSSKEFSVINITGDSGMSTDTLYSGAGFVISNGYNVYHDYDTSGQIDWETNNSNISMDNNQWATNIGVDNMSLKLLSNASVLGGNAGVISMGMAGATNKFFLQENASLTASVGAGGAVSMALLLNSVNSSIRSGVTYSVIAAGDSIIATESNTLYTNNFKVSGGLSKYTVQPITLPGFNDLTMVTKQYVDNSISSLGDITGVTAGAGLSGGGTQGFVTLDVNLGIDGGLTFSGDNIIFDPNYGITKYTETSLALTADVVSTVTHNLGSTGIIAQAWDTTTGEVVIVTFKNRTTNSVDVLSSESITVDVIVQS